MAIREYSKDGQTLYSVYIVKKSQVVHGLKICREAKGLTSITAAQRKEQSLSRIAERDLMKKEQESMGWEHLILEWESAVQNEDIFARKLALASFEDYRNLLYKHTRHWFKLPANQIDKSMAWTVLDKVERELSIARRKKLRSAIDSVFSWGFLSGRIKGLQYTPTEGYQSTNKPIEKPPEILNLEEIRTLLKSAMTIEHHWYPIWAMALLTGMRSGELFALTWGKVDLESGILYVQENWTSKEGLGPTKGRYWRSVPISEELGSLLKQLKLKSRGGYSEKVWKWTDSKRTDKKFYVENQFVLPRFKCWREGRQADILRTFCESVGIKSVKFHTLRACFATQLIKDGIAPGVIMKICGWKDLKTMQRYVRLSGLEVKGATESLRVLPAHEAMGRVVSLFKA